MATDLGEEPAALQGDSSYNITQGAGTIAFPRRGSSWYYPNIETFGGELFTRPPLTSAKREIRIGRLDAKKQARHLERTNEHIRGGLEKRATMVVGATLRVMPQPNWKLLSSVAPGAGLDLEWAKKFAGDCYTQFNDWGFDKRLLQDAEGDQNFGGMMWMASLNLFGPDAETMGGIFYDQTRADAYKTRWATYINVLDPDRCATPPEFINDNSVEDGREKDINGRWTALHISEGHPSDGGFEAITYNRLPRENAMGRPMAWHHFRKKRGGANRGLTSLITVLRASTIFDQFDDATLGNATKAANLATYIKTAASPEVVASQLAPASNHSNGYSFEDKLGYYDKARIRLGGQRVPIMPPEDEIVMAGMASSIADPGSFRNGWLRMFASALGISFEQVSNNFSEANYSSARAALLEMWRGVMFDRVMFCSHVASLVYSAVIEEAIAKGYIKLPPGAPDFYEYREAYTNCSWTGPAMGWIDPQKEATAQAVRLANKTTTRQKEIAEQGGDVYEVFDQLHDEDVTAASYDPPIDLTAAQNPRQAGNPAEPGSDDPNADVSGNPNKKPGAPAPAAPAGPTSTATRKKAA